MSTNFDATEAKLCFSEPICPSVQPRAAGSPRFHDESSPARFQRNSQSPSLSIAHRKTRAKTIASRAKDPAQDCY